MSETKLQLGTIGARVDLLIKQGATFGPHVVTLTNPDGSPTDLTGCSFKGSIKAKARDASVLARFSFTMVSVNPGKFSFQLAATDSAVIPAGENLSDSASLKTYDIKMLDASGRVVPLFYGDAKVFREVTND